MSESHYHPLIWTSFSFDFRLKNFEQQIEKSTKEYNMEKLTTLRTEVDETSRKFEECQDAYATSMYEFISKEQEYTDKIQQVCVCV